MTWLFFRARDPGSRPKKDANEIGSKTPAAALDVSRRRACTFSVFGKSSLVVRHPSRWRSVGGAVSCRLGVPVGGLRGVLGGGSRRDGRGKDGLRVCFVRGASFGAGASGTFVAFSAALSAPIASAGRPVTCSGAFTFAGGLSLACTQPKPSANFWFTAAAAAAVASVTFCTVSFCCTFSSTGAVCSLTLAEMVVAVAVTVFVSPIFSSISISFAPVRRATRIAASVSCSRSTPCAKSSMTGNSVLVQWSPTMPSTAAAISSSVAPCHRLKMRWPAGATVSVQGIT